ncbi:hypothetical protein KAJ61_02465 [Candidatus Parcubacteria bacterium]|nr:hypothetical protein [Candidatus Parcubacteria bacterium]
MFPLTHVYCAKQIANSAKPLLLYGSVFPDIPIVGVVDWDIMEAKTEEFSDYIKQNCSSLIDFAEGLLLHEEPKGIDRFVHGENGYAYVKGKKILKQIKEYFPKNSLNTAHNFIEFAVEILLVENTPNLINEIKPVLKSANNNISQISEVFSEFFNLEIGKTKNSVKKFNNFLLEMDLSSRDKSIQFYTHLINKLKKTYYSEKIIKELLTESINVVEKNYYKFLQDVISSCIKDLSAPLSLRSR